LHGIAKVIELDEDATLPAELLLGSAPFPDEFDSLDDLSFSSLDPFDSADVSLRVTLEDDSTTDVPLSSPPEDEESSQAENASIAKAIALTKPSFFIIFIFCSYTPRKI